MKVELTPGKYVLAVSGGVDSMVLLDLLAHQSGIELVVAHFDHGIRPDSVEDRILVQHEAEKHNLQYIYEEGELGPTTSEAAARDARYEFLRRVQREQGALAIVTAHHQDDVLETAILNILRGTGRKGLTSLQSGGAIRRPLLHVPKVDLLTYAQTHGLVWREDSTNIDDRYARNYVRHLIVPRLDTAARASLLTYITTMRGLNTDIDALLGELLNAESHDSLIRQRFILLPHSVSVELFGAWLRRKHVAFDRRMLNRLTVAAKTLSPGQRADVDATWWLVVKPESLELTSRVSS